MLVNFNMGLLWKGCLTELGSGEKSGSVEQKVRRTEVSTWWKENDHINLHRFLDGG